MDTNETVNDEVLSLDSMLVSLATAKQAMQDATLAYENMLKQIATTHGNTYNHEGQWYQIRSRHSEVEGRKITYICLLKAEPKTWLGGPRKNKTTVPTVVIQAEPAEDEIITSTVID